MSIISKQFSTTAKKITPNNDQTEAASVYNNNSQTAKEVYNSTINGYNNYYDNQSALAQNVLDTAKQNIEQQTSASMQQADILNQRLSKYIGTYNKMNGYSGGLANSNIMQQNANVQNMYAGINKQNASDLTDAQNTYTNAISQLAATRDEGIMGAENTLASTNASNYEKYIENRNTEGATNYTAASSALKYVLPTDDDGEITEETLATIDDPMTYAEELKKVYESYVNKVGSNNEKLTKEYNAYINVLDQIADAKGLHQKTSEEIAKEKAEADAKAADEKKKADEEAKKKADEEAKAKELAELEKNNRKEYLAKQGINENETQITFKDEAGNDSVTYDLDKNTKSSKAKYEFDVSNQESWLDAVKSIVSTTAGYGLDWTSQNKYWKALNNIDVSTLKNGDVINFNYGTDVSRAVYVYSNGKLYKIKNNNQDISTYLNVDGFRQTSSGVFKG